jgi:hypothetical protein
MELQEIFNKAHKHFAGMTEPSMGSKEIDNGQCAYRGAFGNKCIVGAFIPDELYDESLEGDALDPQLNGVREPNTYHNTRVTDVLAKAFGQDSLSIDQYGLLANLQSVHDMHANDWRDGFASVSWYEFIKYEMIDCGEKFNLETNKV